MAWVPLAEWPEDPGELAELLRDWEEPWGDRQQELVFIGAGLDEAAIRARLDATLLGDREMAKGPEAWAKFRDPFPKFEPEAGSEPLPTAAERANCR